MTSNVDVFTADVFYHQSCYNHFVYSYEEKTLSKKMYVFRVFLVRILRISPHSVRMQENTDQKNFEYRRLLRSESTTKTEMTDEEISLLNNSTGREFKVLIKRKILCKNFFISLMILSMEWRTFTRFTVSKEVDDNKK